MSSLSLPIFVKIDACMCEWHPKYAAVAAILRKISFQFVNQSSSCDAKSEIDRDFAGCIAAASELIDGYPCDMI